MNNGYTNQQEAIRQSFANYLGALVGASIFEGQIQKENVIALLCEELCKYICDDNTLDIKTAKPILDASLYILKKYLSEMISMANQANINIYDSKQYKELNDLIKTYEDYILKVKEQ